MHCMAVTPPLGYCISGGDRHCEFHQLLMKVADPVAAWQGALFLQTACEMNGELCTAVCFAKCWYRSVATVVSQVLSCLHDGSGPCC